MFANMSKSSQRSEANVSTENRSVLPSLSLPKVSGAIRGIFEKFTANPVTETVSPSIPIFTIPGSSGFGHQISPSYDSGSGNGPLGFGWSLSLPPITRKPEKGLLKYQDTDKSDEFILSGAEDPVPVLAQHDGNWEREALDRTLPDGSTFNVQNCHPHNRRYVCPYLTLDTFVEKTLQNRQIKHTMNHLMDTLS